MAAALRQTGLLVGTAAAFLLLLTATFTTLSSKRSSPRELLGEEPLFHSINNFDLARPSYHEFDYNRPDYGNALDLNLLGGNVGFFKQRQGTSSLAGSLYDRPIGSGMFPEEVPSFALAGAKPVDEREEMSNTQRSDTARCYGMLHACVNWMAINTGKMRIMVYSHGSWCTDDDIKGDECYHNEDTIQSDEVFDVPKEGEELSQKLWDAIQMSCPVMDGCPKPKAFSNTPESSVYGDLTPAALTEPVQAYLSALQLGKAQCCVKQQQTLMARYRMARAV